MTSWNDCWEQPEDYVPDPARILGAGEQVNAGRDTALEIVNEDSFGTGFRQPEFADAWWFMARMDGCVEFGQMEGGKRSGSEHACDLDQLIALMVRVRDHMKARVPGPGEWSAWRGDTTSVPKEPK